MKIYIARVYIDGRQNVASHFIDAEKDSQGRTEFYFRRIVHNLDDFEKFPIPDMNPATFQEQLRSLNRAYAITHINEEMEQQHQFMNDGVPLFEDNTVALFTFRGWGDLMAAIWSEEEDTDYNYMDFYM